MQRISPKKYATILYELVASQSDDKAKESLSSFVKLVARNKDLAKIDRVIRAFQKLADQQERMTAVTMTTAHPVDHETLQAVTHELKKVLGTDVRLTHSLDQRLIGGAVLRYGDIVVDGSVRKRIELLGKTIAK